MWSKIKSSLIDWRLGNMLTVSREIVVLLSVFLTAVVIFSGADQRNYLVIILIAIVPLLCLIQFPFVRSSEWPIYVFALSLLLTVLLHRDIFRPTSIIYSYLFIISFVFIIRLLHENHFKQETYSLFLKYMIFAYAGVLVIQQVCVVLGLPVFNQIVVDFTARFKLNSLAPEPTYSAVVLPLLMLSYMRLREIKLGRKYNFIKDSADEWLVWIAFIYPMVTMGSGTAFIALILIVFYLIDFGNWKLAIMGVGLFGGAILLLDIFHVEAYMRALNFLKVVFTFDPYLIIITDHSASFRVVPSILYLRMFDITSLNTWFGYGIDFDISYFPEIIPGLEDETGAGGIFPTFVMNFGVLSAIALLTMIRKFCLRSWWSIETLFWIVLVSVWGLNNQFAWAALFLLACNKYFFDLNKRERQTSESSLHSLPE